MKRNAVHTDLQEIEDTSLLEISAIWYVLERQNWAQKYEQSIFCNIWDMIRKLQHHKLWQIEYVLKNLDSFEGYIVEALFITLKYFYKIYLYRASISELH